MEWFLCLIFVYLIFAPPKYDPAIRFKEWLMKNNGEDHG